MRDEELFSPGREQLCERFVERVLHVEGVRSVSLDRAQATAAIRHTVSNRELGRLLDRLNDAIRNKSSREPMMSMPRAIRRTTCTVFRHGSLLTSCDVVSDQPGRLRLDHESFGTDRALTREVQGRLTTAPGVTRVAALPWSTSLLIRYNDALTDSSRLIRLVEECLDSPRAWSDSLPGSTPTRFALPSATVAIAGLADFAVPGLMPVSAFLLVCTNIRTFKDAWQQLRGRRVGLPVLYTAIASTALATGQFLSCALMSLFYKIWTHRLRIELTTERRLLLHECLPRPRSACLIASDGSEVLVPVDRLGRGDRVVVNAGETVPGDGRVISGEGIVDERSLRGLDGASRKSEGDSVLAGSIVLAGSLRLLIAELGDRTRASTIARALVAATSPANSTPSRAPRAEAFANRAVGPALATAGLGLLVGDIASAGAILAPDYATGPGLTVPLETLRNTALCARRGIVVRHGDVFERLAQVDLIVLDDDTALSWVETEVTGIQTQYSESEVLRYAASAFRHLADDRAAALIAACRSRGVHVLDLRPVEFSPGVTVVHGRRRIRVLENGPAADGLGPLVVEIDGDTIGSIRFGRSTRAAAAAAVRRIRAIAPVPIALVSNRAESDVSLLGSLLGADLHKGGFAPEDTGNFVRACRERGLRTAFVGRCRRHAMACAEAYVAISHGEDDLPSDSVAASLLQSRLDLFADLWETARTHEGRVLDAQKLVMVPNVLCVAGAFLFGFTGLTAVIITNLGTFGLYSRAMGSLSALKTSKRGGSARPMRSYHSANQSAR
jgi:Cu2+-exporting ATPase